MTSLRPAAGEVVADRYQVGDQLGRGGMAEVRAGTDLRLQRQVAIKFLLPEMAARPEIRTRFEAEARAAASLSHPNAVAVFDTGEHGGAPYIVMERLPGETLADRIAARPAGRGEAEDVEAVRTLAREVLGALGAAHAAGLVHRDVKPANILLAADGRAKVADFGIAKSVQETSAGSVPERSGGDLTATGQIFGTPAYLAPERVDGAPATPQADLWSLGVVLYEVLTGARPFAGDTPLATARAAAGGEHRPLGEVRPDLDPALVAAVERAMDPDPSARFASAGEMAAALETAAGAAPTLALAGPGDTQVLTQPVPPEPAPAAPPAPPAWRRLLPWVAAGALAVAVVLLLVVSGDDDRPSSSPATSSAPGAGADPTTARVPTTAEGSAATLAEDLRDAAGRLDADDGRLAPVLADRLRTLADSVEAGGGGGDATTLLIATAAWARAGQLDASTASSITDLLRRVPGINNVVIDAVVPSIPGGGGDGGGDGDGGGGDGKEDKEDKQSKGGD